MADKPPLLTVDDAGFIMDKFGYKAIMIVGIREDGQIDVASYGKTKADCRVIGDYAQKQWGDNIPVTPFQTWFGWGNGGVPVKLSRRDYESLNDRQRAYVDANTHPQADEA